MSYAELLKDPRWQRKRLEALALTDFHCIGCGSGDKTLNVHHRQYRQGAMPWEYDKSELEVLCEDCHSRLHAAREMLHSIIDSSSYGPLFTLLGYAQATQSLWNDARWTVLVKDGYVLRGILDAFRQYDSYDPRFCDELAVTLSKGGGVDLVDVANNGQKALDRAIEESCHPTAGA